MKKLFQDLLVSACGLATSILTAIVLYLVERWSGHALYTLSVWVIVPVGAIGAGFLASSGYYGGAKLFRVRPSPLLLVNILAISAASFLLVYWLSYATMVVKGVQVSDIISFTDYLDFQFSHSSMRVGYRIPTSSPMEMGSFGYITAVLHILGFAVGGLVVYIYLSQEPYCDTCNIYLKKSGKQSRYDYDPDSFMHHVSGIAQFIREEDFQGAIVKHSEHGGLHQGNSHLRSEVEIRACPKCNMNWFKFTVSKRKGDSWSDIGDMCFNTCVFNQLRITAGEK